MKKITACIDGKTLSGPICDLAAWTSQRLDVPTKILHVIEKPQAPAKDDLSGAIGFGSREHLLEELVALDEQRGRLAMEHGKHLLEEAKKRIENLGVQDIETQQRHGRILETLTEMEAETRVFVLGGWGEDHAQQGHGIGSHLESVVRAIHTPLLVAVGPFQPPKSFLLAYDGSVTADVALDKVSKSALLKGIKGHVVMVGSENTANQEQLTKASEKLSDNGHHIESHLLKGSVVESLNDFAKIHDIGMFVMGAYGHSRVKEFFVGSNTTKMISASQIPLLLLR